MTTKNKQSQPQPNTRPPLKVMIEGQICPDGVVININWESFVIGSSIFIPAINLSRLQKQVQTIAKDRKIQLKGLERIEAGKLGMRFWRIL
jgi:hypothetical protein